MYIRGAGEKSELRDKLAQAEKDRREKSRVNTIKFAKAEEKNRAKLKQQQASDPYLGLGLAPTFRQPGIEYQKASGENLKS